MRINSYGSIGCIRFEGIISALTVGTLLMFDAAKIQQKCESGKQNVERFPFSIGFVGFQQSFVIIPLSAYSRMYS